MRLVDTVYKPLLCTNTPPQAPACVSPPLVVMSDMLMRWRKAWNACSGSGLVNLSAAISFVGTVTGGVVVTGIVQSFNELYQRSFNHGAWFNELLVT